MSPIISSRITLRSALIYIGILTITIGFVLYVVFQARFLLVGPQITLTDQNVVQEARIVTIEGRVENIVNLTLNDRSIYTDESGYFKETLILENGYTVATLRAHDRYGRQTVRTQSFVYVPSEESDINS